MSRRNTAFTLVELLMVIAIMTVLITITTSRLGTNHSAQLTASGDRVAMMIAQARQIARTNQSLTGLAMVTSSGNSELDYRAFALLEIFPDETEWRMISPWERLPDAVTVNAQESITFENSPPPAVAFPPLRRGTTTIAPDAYSVQVFRPSGQLLQNSIPPSLSLNLATGQADNFFKIIISPATGLPLIERPDTAPAPITP